MKGVVFTEFLELVEGAYGMETADKVITKGCPFHMGFTAVGNYDHHELLAMVGELSKETQTETSELVRAFGTHLFSVFRQNYPESFEGIHGTVELLRSVESSIHVEVFKLNPDAELPKFTFPECDEGVFEIVYQSSRPFADLAHGLIEAAIEYFQEQLRVERFDLDGVPGTHALFRLTRS